MTTALEVLEDPAPADGLSVATPDRRSRSARRRARRGTVPPRSSTPKPTAAAPRPAIVGLLLRHGSIAAVLAGYAVAALIVPTMTAAPVGDDWVYTRSVEILWQEGELRILDLSVVTLVFQVAWGALFAAIFGLGFGALRLSTVTLMLLSGWACYGLCRELGVARAQSALGAAAYLFNPLAFVLGFTFMTDPQFTALLVIASLGYVRGLRACAMGSRSDRLGDLALLGGSVAAALAFLVRQQGALIPFAVVVALYLGRRLHVDRTSLVLVTRIVAIPVAATVLYYLWLFLAHGVPYQQQAFTRQVRDAGWDESWLLIQRMTFIEAMYLGFFALPVAFAALLAVGRLPRFRSPLGWLVFAGWVGVIAVGLVVFGGEGRRMPYIPQYLGLHGLGPDDLQGGRATLAHRSALGLVTAVCAASALLLGLALCRRLPRPRTPDPTRLGAAVALSIALWQAIGILPPSFHFRNWIISVDRYLLPLLPFAICLGLWALRDVRLALPHAWVVVAAYAVFSVAGTRDFLVFQDATWDLARAATELGVPLTRLEGGASWGGYHLWEYSHVNRIPQQTPGGPWWTNLFASATNSDYVVSSSPWTPPGYNVLGQLEYSSWLHDDPTRLYLLRRQGMQGLP